jgi:hypothetical protein
MQFNHTQYIIQTTFESLEHSHKHSESIVDHGGAVWELKILAWQVTIQRQLGAWLPGTTQEGCVLVYLHIVVSWAVDHFSH